MEKGDEKGGEKADPFAAFAKYFDEENNFTITLGSEDSAGKR